MCDSPCGVEMSLVARESLVRFPHIMVFNEGVVDADLSVVGLRKERISGSRPHVVYAVSVGYELCGFRRLWGCCCGSSGLVVDMRSP